jgi:hypothetical protein
MIGRAPNSTLHKEVHSAMKTSNSRQYSISFHVPLLLMVLLFGACKPDLIVKNVHHEQFIATSLGMKGTIENQGQKASGDSITTLEHRSDLNDPFIPTTRISTPSLRPGENKELVLWLFPPNLLPPQARCLQVRVCADADNTINESSETNNCVTKSYPEVCP